MIKWVEQLFYVEGMKNDKLTSSFLHFTRNYEVVPLTRCSTKYHCLSIVLFVLLQYIACNDQMLNLTCSLVYLSDSGIAVVSLRRHLGHVPHTAKNLNCLMRTHRCSFTSSKFGHGCFPCEQFFLIFQLFHGELDRKLKGIITE